MKEIWLVISASGEYEDYNEWPEVACPSEHRANELIEGYKRDEEDYNYAVDLLNAYYHQWSKENPDPEYEELIERPCWAPGLPAERDAINELNAIIREKNRARHEAHRESRNDAKQKFLNSWTDERLTKHVDDFRDEYETYYSRRNHRYFARSIEFILNSLSIANDERDVK